MEAMNMPEKIAAILAIRLLEVRKRDTTIKIFEFRRNCRSRIEKLASTFLKEGDLPIKPYMPHVVYYIADHFENRPGNSALPTEQEVIDWIAESGGISGLLLKKMASGS
jgi:hypothetical protein